MPPAFLQVAIPVLYVYDEGTLPEVPPGFDMGLLPVISRALKEHANTSRVTVITGAPTAAEDLPRAYTSLGLQYSSIKKASPEAGNLLVAEFVADHFDLDAVLEHMTRIRDERQRALAESVEAHLRKAEGGEGGVGEEGEAEVGSGGVEPIEGLEAEFERAVDDAGEDEDEDGDDGHDDDDDDDAADGRPEDRGGRGA